MNASRVSSLIFACLLSAISVTTSRAEVIDLYTENFDAFDVVSLNDFGDGVNPYGIQTINAGTSPVSPFGTGDAIRLLDLYDADKPEIHGELAAPLFEPFRVDFQSFNNSGVDNTKAIRFRMGNSGLNVTSEKRAAFSVSWQSDGDVGGKYSGAEDGIGDVDTKNSAPLDPGVHDITMIANGALTGTYTYDIFGETRTLDPLHYDLYIDGELLNSSNPGDSKHDDFKNGLQFHYDKSDSEYDPALGLQRFGLFSSGSSDTGPDVYFDNIILTTGADIGNTIPEPTSLALLAGCSAVAASVRRRR